MHNDIMEKFEGFDDYAKTCLKDWKIPGAALAVIKGDKVIYKSCYGVRDLKTNVPVDFDTQYMLASNTKSFTALSLGILVDEGRLEWDKPIKNYIPDFKLYDDFLTERVTARDLLSHRTGIPPHDWALHSRDFTRKDIVDRLRYLEPNFDLRVKLQYNNRMLILAAYILECITGEVWEHFVQKRIFEPLEMNNTYFSHYKARQTGNFSEHYYYDKNGVCEVPIKFEENYDPEKIEVWAPAGAINSTINDMVKFSVMQINKGKYKDKQIISEKNLKEQHTPAMVDDWGDYYFGKSNESGALGWFVYNYRGQIIVSHGGAWGTHIYLLPDKNIAIVYLQPIWELTFDSICFNIIDRILDLEPIDWNDFVIKRNYGGVNSGVDNSNEMKENAEIVPPSHPLSEYTGIYEHPAYLKLSVQLKDGNLDIIEHDNTILRHLNGEIFEMIENDSPIMKFTFHTDGNGRVSKVSAPLEPTVKDIVFERVN